MQVWLFGCSAIFLYQNLTPPTLSCPLPCQPGLSSPVCVSAPVPRLGLPTLGPGSAVQCSAVQYSAVQCSAVQCSLGRLSSGQCSRATPPYVGPGLTRSGHRRTLEYGALTDPWARHLFECPPIRVSTYSSVLSGVVL